MTKLEEAVFSVVQRYPGITEEGVEEVLSSDRAAIYVRGLAETGLIERRERGTDLGYYPTGWQSKSAGSGVVAGPITIGRGYRWFVPKAGGVPLRDKKGKARYNFITDD